MGNCQAIDTATLVIQHPNGKAERLYWPVSASEVMKTNPGHYVALLISSTLCPTKDNENCSDNNNNENPSTNPLRITRIKLLKPTDTLVLGQVYRLITTQDVMKGLWAKKQAKMKKNMGKTGLEMDKAARRSEAEDKQVIKGERQRARTGPSSTNSGSVTANKLRTWQPSLLSISESAS
ncbi:rhoGEF domain-containing protein gxcJ [Senna tora]|uniref:RhoGEF domain-containing protein gxcJ n=1 Tax=Senna tora TaxID=362788 RepID=A0A834SZ43_9FABA|nr:rhoGEF domain-containing protein gxcJ [Senna tora]